MSRDQGPRAAKPGKYEHPLFSGIVLNHCLDFNDITCKISLADVFKNLPGLLRHNPVEASAYQTFREDKDNSFIETVFKEIYELHLPQIEGKWGRDDRICLECWTEILRLGARDWWFATKKSCRTTFFATAPDSL